MFGLVERFIGAEGARGEPPPRARRPDGASRRWCASPTRSSSTRSSSGAWSASRPRACRPGYGFLPQPNDVARAVLGKIAPGRCSRSSAISSSSSSRTTAQAIEPDAALSRAVEGRVHFPRARGVAARDPRRARVEARERATSPPCSATRASTTSSRWSPRWTASCRCRRGPTRDYFFTLRASSRSSARREVEAAFLERVPLAVHRLRSAGRALPTDPRRHGRRRADDAHRRARSRRFSNDSFTKLAPATRRCAGARPPRGCQGAAVRRRAAGRSDAARLQPRSARLRGGGLGVRAPLRALPMNERERTHAAALAAAIDGDFARACGLYDRILDDEPADALALWAAHDPGLLPRRTSSGCAAGTSRVLQHWSPRREGYHAVLAMHAFGLAGMRRLRAAEEWRLRALELEPRDLRAEHALLHVLEMQGKRRKACAGRRGMRRAGSSSTTCGGTVALFMLAARPPARGARASTTAACGSTRSPT